MCNQQVSLSLSLALQLSENVIRWSTPADWIELKVGAESTPGLCSRCRLRTDPCLPGNLHQLDKMTRVRVTFGLQSAEWEELSVLVSRSEQRITNARVTGKLQRQILDTAGVMTALVSTLAALKA